MLLNGIVLYSFYILLTRHAWKRLAVSLALGALLSAVLNYLLVPPYGFVGAASALIAVHVFLSIILLPQAQKVLPARVSAMQMLQWIAFSVVLAGALWVLLPFTTSIPRTIGGLVVVAACIAAMVWVLSLIHI